MGFNENGLVNVGVTTYVKLSVREQTPEWQCRTCLLSAYCQLRPYAQRLNQKLMPLYLMAVLWEMSLFLSLWDLCFHVRPWMEFVCSALGEDLSSFSQIVFYVRIKPFLILLLLNKPMDCSFLSESMKSVVTLIFKMLKRKAKSFTG